MGDASQTGNLKKSRFSSQVIVEGQNHSTVTLDPQEEIPRTSVLYTHAASAECGLLPAGNTVTCRSLEELLSLLETDLVDSLWFDTTVSPQERAYITGWARIFRPSVSAHLLQEQIAN
jgi:hypothetical protein